ncbi:hypothetical protein ABPG72_020579 [Tetrahymena utriculariae]
MIALALRIGRRANEILQVLICHFKNNIFENGFREYLNGSYSSNYNPRYNLQNIFRERIFQDESFQRIHKNTLVTSAQLDQQNNIIPVCFVRFLRTEQDFDQNVQQNICKLSWIQSQLNNHDLPVNFEEEQIRIQNAPLWQIASSASATYPYLNKFKFNFPNNPPHPDREYIDGGNIFNNVDILLIEYLKQKDISYKQQDELNGPIQNNEEDEQLKLFMNQKYLVQNQIYIQSLEQIYQDDYMDLNEFVDQIDINQIRQKNSSFQDYCDKDGKEIEKKLAEILSKFRMQNNQNETIQMIQPRNTFIQKLVFKIDCTEDGKQICKNQQFKGVFQLAASIESLQILKKQYLFQNYLGKIQNNIFYNRLEKINGMHLLEHQQIIELDHQFMYYHYLLI